MINRSHWKGSLAGNFAFSFGSQTVVIATAFACIHPLIDKLGNEAFGLLSLLWLIIGYFSLFDLGIGQAVTKYVSEAIAKGERAVAAALIRRAAKLTFLLGMAGSVIVVIISLIGVERFFTISEQLKGESRNVLLLLSICLPATLLQGSLRGIPMAFNRFGPISVAQAVSGVIQWGGAVLAAYSGGGLLGVVIVTIISRYFLLSVYGWLISRLIPEVFRRTSSLDRETTKRFLRFGGWVSVSQLIAPTLTFMERFIIGTLLSLSWVTFFAIPSEIVVRLLIVPMSIVNALFPFMSRNWILQAGKQQVKMVYQRSVKYLYLAVVPIVFFLIFFSRDIFSIWLGVEFVEKSSLILVVLAVGYLFNSLSQIPNIALLALGRPDLPAKISLVQLPLYTGVFIACTMMWGILGSAVAWLIRVSIESLVLFGFTNRLMHDIAISNDLSYFWKATVFLAVAGIFILVGQLNSLSFTVQGLIILVTGIVYVLGLWYFAFDEEDRQFVQRYTLRASR